MDQLFLEQKKHTPKMKKVNGPNITNMTTLSTTTKHMCMWLRMSIPQKRPHGTKQKNMMVTKKQVLTMQSGKSVNVIFLQIAAGDVAVPVAKKRKMSKKRGG